MKLAIKIIAGVALVAVLALIYLLNNYFNLSVDLGNYIKTQPARKNRWKEEEKQPDAEPEDKTLKVQSGNNEEVLETKTENENEKIQ